MAPTPAPGDEIEYLKSLRSRLDAKIVELEKKVKPPSPSSPKLSKELRMILVGPPGAGKYIFLYAHSPSLNPTFFFFIYYSFSAPL
jgi:hypothetical protein